MKNILVIHNQSAMNTLSGKEALDFSLIFGSYEEVVTVLFYGEGATQALAHQDPELIKQKDYLSELDRAIGDGDHGGTMSIGWTAIKEKLSSIKLYNSSFNLRQIFLF